MPLIGFALTDRALDFLETLPPKTRKQVINRAKALHTNPFPQGCKKLQNVETKEGEPVYRERSGDYRILYVVRQGLQTEVVILDIDNRKNVYRMPKTNSEPANELRMKQGDFDDIMRKALGVPPPAKNDDEPEPAKRLSAYPPKQRDR